MEKSLRAFVTNFGQMLNFAPSPASNVSERIRRTREAIGARSDMEAMRRDVAAIGQDMARVISRESRG